MAEQPKDPIFDRCIGWTVVALSCGHASTLHRMCSIARRRRLMRSQGCQRRSSASRPPHLVFSPRGSTVWARRTQPPVAGRSRARATERSRSGRLNGLCRYPTAPALSASAFWASPPPLIMRTGAFTPRSRMCFSRSRPCFQRSPIPGMTRSSRMRSNVARSRMSSASASEYADTTS